MTYILSDNLSRLDSGIPEKHQIKNLEEGAWGLDPLIDKGLKWLAFLLNLFLSPRFKWIAGLMLADRLRWRWFFRLCWRQLHQPLKAQSNSDDGKIPPIKALGEYDPRGTTRRSFLIKQKEPKQGTEFDNNWWVVVVATGSGGGCGGGGTTKTYSCNCPDKVKTAVPSASYSDDQPDYLGRKFKPRTFQIEGYKKYKSQFERYNRAFKMIEKIEYRGIQDGNQQVYRLYTNRNEKYGRNWSSSGAGVEANQDCKHQWAVKFYRGDNYSIPIDVPDIPSPIG